MSPSICSHKKAHFPKVGSGRDPPYLRGEGAKYIYVHIHICGQRPAPHRRAQSPAQTLCLEDGAEAMKGEEWIQVFPSFPERSCFEGREKHRDTQQGRRDLSALPVRLGYSRSPLWIACCSLAVALQWRALPLPPLAEMTVRAGATSPLGDALEKPPTTSLQGNLSGEKSSPRGRAPCPEPRAARWILPAFPAGIRFFLGHVPMI